MELSQLRDAVRDALDDNSNPPLYPDAELDRYLNNAVAEACLRARLYQDDSSDLTRIPLEVGVARYALDPCIFAVRAVHVSGRTRPVVRTTSARLDDLCPGWSHLAQTNATPEYAVFDVQQKTLTLHPPPANGGTLYLRVWRQPSEAERMEDDGDEPAVLLTSPETLKHWALHEAYLKKDSELYDADKSGAHLGLFVDRYGERPNEHTLTLWSTQPTSGPRRAQLDY